jgi:cytochrome c5
MRHFDAAPGNLFFQIGRYHGNIHYTVITCEMEEAEMNKAIVYLAAGLFLTVTSVYAADKPSADAKALFEGKCGTCHSIDRPKAKNKSAAEWEKTVMRMKSNGCSLSNDEAKAIIDYLADNYGPKK